MVPKSMIATKTIAMTEPLKRLRLVIRDVRHETKVLRTYKRGEEIVQETVDLGWFVSFEGSWEAISWSTEKPGLGPGQVLIASFERE